MYLSALVKGVELFRGWVSRINLLKHSNLPKPMDTFPYNKVSQSQHHWHFRLDYSLLWGCPCITGYLAASLSSTHYMPTAPTPAAPSVTEVYQGSSGVSTPFSGDFLLVQVSVILRHGWKDRYYWQRRLSKIQGFKGPVSLKSAHMSPTL